ncbi:MAG: glycerate kinase [Atopobiaceae bacterium]|nr:glycerate kinase [Atopobiaceae bacterium]
MDSSKPPRVLVASDSFKGSASSARVNDLIEQGLRRACPDVRVRKVLVADGGEGTVEAVVSARGGTIRHVVVPGPLGGSVDAALGLFDGGRSAVVEMASAAGITLSDRSRESALAASTRGVGELVLDAIDHGARRVYVGLGGSATTDGGAGFASALGARLLDDAGAQVAPGAAGLERLARVDLSGLDARLAGAEVVGLTDVTNPLAGPAGAAATFGPQKGLTAADLPAVDAWLGRLGRLLGGAVGADVASLPGAGAAGGLGCALAALCGARLTSGIDFVLDGSRLDEALADADLAITGEGRMDAQSARGKAPVGIARRCARAGVPVIAVVGSRAEDLGDVYSQGIDLVVPALVAPATLEECVARVARNVPVAAETAMRAFLLGRKAGAGSPVAQGSPTAPTPRRG